jgi:hypothetical protein
VRYAATGRRSGKARATVPYSTLTDAGYLPLVSAFWTMRTNPRVYDELVARRTGIA